MRRTLIVIALALGVAVSPAAPLVRETTGAAPENRVIEEEWAMAKTADFYFMINLGARTIDLKARGFILKRWTPDRVRFWGAPVAFKTVYLARKTALTLPQRRVLKPGEPDTVSTKPGQFELEALEVKDMPRAYTLELADGTRISVAPRVKGLFAFWKDIKWYIGLPLKTVKLGLKKKTMTLIEFGFEDPREGQAMYWALTEGLKGLVWLTQPQ